MVLFKNRPGRYAGPNHEVDTTIRARGGSKVYEWEHVIKPVEWPGESAGSRWWVRWRCLQSVVLARSDVERLRDFARRWAEGHVTGIAKESATACWCQDVIDERSQQEHCGVCATDVRRTARQHHLSLPRRDQTPLSTANDVTNVTHRSRNSSYKPSLASRRSSLWVDWLSSKHNRSISEYYSRYVDSAVSRHTVPELHRSEENELWLRGPGCKGLDWERKGVGRNWGRGPGRVGEVWGGKRTGSVERRRSVLGMTTWAVKYERPNKKIFGGKGAKTRKTLGGVQERHKPSIWWKARHQTHLHLAKFS